MGSSGRSIVFLNQKTIQLTGKRSEQPLTDFRLSTAPYFLGFGWTFDSLPPTTTTIQLPIHFVSSHHLPFSFSSFVMPQPDYLAPPVLPFSPIGEWPRPVGFPTIEGHLIRIPRTLQTPFLSGLGHIFYLLLHAKKIVFFPLPLPDSVGLRQLCLYSIRGLKNVSLAQGFCFLKGPKVKIK